VNPAPARGTAARAERLAARRRCAASPRLAPRRFGDHGLSVPLVALSMVVVLVFVAFSVDVGLAYNVRRQSQSASDAAALGAGLELGNSALSLATQRTNAADYAIGLSYEDISQPPTTLTDWQTMFAACTDSGALAITSSPSACVSFSNTMQRLRVRMPDQEVETAFAGVVGVDSIEVSTAAEAQANLISPGGVLPFGIGIGSTGDDQVCLKDGTSLVGIPICDGPSSGNFNVLDFTLYGNDSARTLTGTGISFTTPQLCTGKELERAIINTIIGVDHPLAKHPDPNSLLTTADRRESTGCGTTGDFFYQPNGVDSRTGQLPDVLEQGLFTGPAYSIANPGLIPALQGYGRLRGDAPLSYDVRMTPWGGRPAVDATPLWSYITPGLVNGDAPNECISAAGGGYPDTPDEMLLCLQRYRSENNSAHKPLFARDTDGDAGNGIYDIMRSPRFGWVPLLHLDLSNGTSVNYRFVRFRPVYIDALFWKAPGSNPDPIFQPGRANPNVPSNNSYQARGMTAWVIRDPMLPAEIIEQGPGRAGQIEWRLVE
jgi:hypothetical protein